MADTIRTHTIAALAEAAMAEIRALARRGRPLPIRPPVDLEDLVPLRPPAPATLPR